MISLSEGFDDDDINSINSLSCLKKCGMSIGEIKEYLNWCIKWQSFIPER